MALTVQLFLDTNSSGKYSKSFLLSDFKCRVARPHNQWRPDGIALCDYLELSLPAPPMDGNQKDLTLYNWYVDRSPIDGYIYMELPNYDQAGGPQEKKYIYFEQGRCFAIEEQFHINLQETRTLKLKIAAENLKIETVELTVRNDDDNNS